MNFLYKNFQSGWARVLLFPILIFVFAGHASGEVSTMNDDSTSVRMTGIQHLRRDFTMNMLVVDGYWLNNVAKSGAGRAGGGGSNVCCVSLPKQWRPGLTVDVRWTVGDWSGKAGLSMTPPSDSPFINFETHYWVKVPIEKYDVPEHVYIHIFMGGKARAVSTAYAPEGKSHPIQDNDPHAADSATVSASVDSVFSDEPEPDLKRKNEEQKKESRVQDDHFIKFYMTGVKHLGPDFDIADFYVDGHSAGNVEREGSAYEVCCVLLPKQWHPGLTVEVRWVVGDWSKENSVETAARNYKSIRFTRYKAIVPVEKYEEPYLLHMHFFEGGKVRVVSSAYYSDHVEHPIKYGDPHASDNATVGKGVDILFTQDELTKMRLKGDVSR